MREAAKENWLWNETVICLFFLKSDYFLKKKTDKNINYTNHKVRMQQLWLWCIASLGSRFTLIAERRFSSGVFFIPNMQCPQYPTHSLLSFPPRNIELGALQVAQTGEWVEQYQYFHNVMLCSSIKIIPRNHPVSFLKDHKEITLRNSSFSTLKYTYQ